jgi:hypothetical protein
MNQEVEDLNEISCVKEVEDLNEVSCVKEVEDLNEVSCVKEVEDLNEVSHFVIFNLVNIMSFHVSGQSKFSSKRFLTQIT